MTEWDAESLQILIRQLWKNVDLNALFGKTRGVLGHAEPIEPVRNLQRRCHQQSLRGETEFLTNARVYTDISGIARLTYAVWTRSNFQYQIRLYAAYVVNLAHFLTVNIR